MEYVEVACWSYLGKIQNNIVMVLISRSKGGSGSPIYWQPGSLNSQNRVEWEQSV